MPRYILKQFDGKLEKFSDGVIKLIFCKYDRKTKSCIYRELIPFEKIEELLSKLHNIDLRGNVKKHVIQILLMHLTNY